MALREQCELAKYIHGIHMIWKIKPDRGRPVKVNEFKLFYQSFKTQMGFDFIKDDDKDRAQRRSMAEIDIKKWENIP